MLAYYFNRSCMTQMAGEQCAPATLRLSIVHMCGSTSADVQLVSLW